MARNLSVGVQRGLRQSIGGGLGTGDIFTLSSASFDFARTGTADSRITHTRASSATYVDGDGVIKTATTNLLLRSEELNVTPWYSTGGVTVAEDYTQGVPFEGAKVYKVIFPVTNAGLNQGFTYLAQEYAASIYVKGTQGDTIRFAGKTGFSASNHTFNGEWERLSQTFTPTAGAANFNLNTAGLSAVTAYVAAPQLELSSTVGEYVKTTSTINSAPRFDHDPATGESLGLLIEEARTNLLEYSEDILSWSSTTGGSPVITPNAATAPDGSLTATSIQNSTVAAFLGDATSFTSGNFYTFSGYFKAGTGDQVTILLYSTAENARWDNQTANVARSFDLTNGTSSAFGLGSTDPTSWAITPAGNGWYRCSITAEATADSTNPNQLIRNMSGAGEDILAWGFQIEEGSFLTSHIPTSGSTVTRVADVTEITGTNFSSWYNQTEGTVFASGVARAPDTKFPNYAEINDGSLNNRINFGYLTDTLSGFVVRESGAITSQLYPPTSAVFRKSATAISSNDFAISADGGTVLTTNSGNLYTPIVAMSVGANGVHTGNFMNGTIFRLTYWPERLPNATLQTITN